MRSSRKLSIVVGLFLIVVGWLSLVHRQELVDRWKLLNYEPSTEIQALADESGMSERGRRIYYVTHPILDDKTSFANHCPVTESTIVLGCFDGRQIFILKVNEPKLDGVEQVTAAHEMLHAAYKRLPPTEKQRIKALVRASFTKLNDPSLNKTYEVYQKTEPGEEDNELHSILGTEYGSLDPELETYYKRYFDDRTKVVTLAKKYSSVFKDLQNQVAEYDQQLADLKNSIEAQQFTLGKEQTSVNAERARLDKLLSTGQIQAYNDAVPAFNQSIANYNASVAKLQSDVAEYNKLVVERNKLATAQRDLTNSLEATYKPLGN